MKRIRISGFKKRVFETFRQDLLEHFNCAMPLHMIPQSKERRMAFKKLEEAISYFKIVFAKSDLCE